MTTFARVAAVLALMIGAAFILLILAIAAITLPIDEGGEVSRLATAGIMRNADV